MGVEAAFAAELGQYRHLPSNLNAFNVVMKHWYEDAVKESVPYQTATLSQYAGDPLMVAGERYIVLQHTEGNQAILHTGPRGKLANPGRQEHIRLSYDMKYGNARGLIDGPAIDASRNRTGAFVDLLDREMTKLPKDIGVHMNRVIHGNGTGHLAQIVPSSKASPSVQLRYPGGFANTGGGVQYIRKGMLLGAVSADGTTFRADIRKVSSVTVATNMITLDGSIASWDDSATPDYIIIVSDTTGVTINDTTHLREPFGLASWVDNANPSTTPALLLGEVNAATEEAWRSFVVGGTGAGITLTVDLIEQTLNGVDVLYDDAEIDCHHTTHGLRRQYLNRMQARRMFVGTMNFDGGWSAVTYNGKPIFVDRDATRGRWYMVAKNQIRRIAMVDWSWMDYNGILFRLSDYDGVQFTMKATHNFAVYQRNCHAVIKDLNDG